MRTIALEGHCASPLASPCVEQLDEAESVALARQANDRLANAVRRHPSRYFFCASFASFTAMQS